MMPVMAFWTKPYHIKWLAIIFVMSIYIFASALLAGHLHEFSFLDRIVDSGVRTAFLWELPTPFLQSEGRLNLPLRGLLIAKFICLPRRVVLAAVPAHALFKTLLARVVVSITGRFALVELREWFDFATL